jgi:hypothetical protein
LRRTQQHIPLTAQYTASYYTNWEYTASYYTNCAAHSIILHELRSTQHHITRTAQHTASYYTNCAVHSILHELRSTQHHTQQTNGAVQSITANELRCCTHYTQYTNCAEHITHSTRAAQYTASQQTNCAVHSIKHGKFRGNFKTNAYIVRGTDDSHTVDVTQCRPCRWQIVGLSLRRPGINQTPVHERRVSLPVHPLPVSVHLCSILICLSV